MKYILILAAVKDGHCKCCSIPIVLCYKSRGDISNQLSDFDSQTDFLISTPGFIMLTICDSSWYIPTMDLQMLCSPCFRT